MRKIEEEEVYKFNELPEEIQQEVIYKNRCCNVEESWSDSTIENLTIELNNIGFIRSKIHFTGFYSQGDGACFDCNNFDINLLLKHVNLSEKENSIISKIKEYITIEINKRGNYNIYNHESTRYAQAYINGREFKRIDKIVNSFSNEIEKLRYNKCISMYKELEVDYDYLTSDDVIKDHLISNECEFYINGTPY